jgi:hypothetical protein
MSAGIAVHTLTKNVHGNWGAGVLARNFGVGSRSWRLRTAAIRGFPSTFLAGRDHEA